MANHIIRKLIALRKQSFVTIGRKTLLSLFPFFLFATFTVVISESVFSTYGLINHLLSVESWFPYFRETGRAFENLTALTASMTAPLAAYFSAKYTTSHYGQRTEAAAITAFIFSLLANSREFFTAPLTDGVLTRINLPVEINLIVAIAVGYGVGQVFRFSTSSDENHSVYHSKNLRPIIQVLGCGVLLNLIYTLANNYRLLTAFSSFFSNFTANQRSMIRVPLDTLARSFSVWIGNSTPFSDAPFGNDTTALDNLNYVLKHHTTVGLPNLFSETNLYDAYGAFAGVGGTLALLVAILLVSKNSKDRNISVKSLFPSLFSHGIAFMSGIPIFFNLLFLLPFVLVPLVNVILAGFLLYFRVMPPAVYPVPNGTPNMLYAFIGSGGSVRALAVGVFLFIVDILIYLPFVIFNDRISTELNLLDNQGEVHD